MCGIAGFINLDGMQAEMKIAEEMSKAIKHRGPDGAGIYLEENMAFAHHRLAIIDLTESANQPMCSEDKRYALIYNGEIYNFRELRSTLIAAGLTFRTNSDTEVLLQSLIHWGSDALLKFNGMFAFAFWDRAEKKLLLARDRYGIKPLYIGRQGNILSFASTQKAVSNSLPFAKVVDNNTILEYFNFQNIFSDSTFLKNISLFPAGHFATLNFNKGERDLTYEKYWDYDFSSSEIKVDFPEYQEELVRLITNAVDSHLVGDTEVGCYLSGGLDSGSIASMASRDNRKIKTFTVGFDLGAANGIETAFDERENAEAMSNFIRSEHYELVLNSGHIKESIGEIVRNLEDPRVGQSYPNYYAAKLASRFVKVVLSGSGGDELFGGYPWRYYVPETKSSFESYSSAYFGNWQRLVDGDSIVELFNPIRNEVDFGRPQAVFSGILKKGLRNKEIESKSDYLNLALYFEAKTFLQGLFMVEDKLSMAFGLETRVPFMDNNIVDFAMRCPTEFKFGAPTKYGSINENSPINKKATYQFLNQPGKQILRNSLEKYMPPNHTQIKKQGFSGPDSSWFRGESLDYVKKLLLNENARIYEFLDRKMVNKILDLHFEKKENRRLFIWSLIYFETWLCQF